MSGGVPTPGREGRSGDMGVLGGQVGPPLRIVATLVALRAGWQAGGVSRNAAKGPGHHPDTLCTSHMYKQTC